ncbi:MAG: glycosyltransferase family 4 protein [Crocinitomicaceae bacterium]|nr:glycosyltransferase family 4 protein [Crocinitomicaceae bacterium]
MEKPNLNYFHVGLSSFVKKDIEILSKEFSLNIHFFDQSSKSRLPLSFLKQFFFLLTKLFKSKATVVQFGGYHSFLPVFFKVIFRKKVIIVLGGTDCVGFPSIQYGCFYNKYLKYFTRFSLKYATLLLPVAEALVHSKYTYNSDDYPYQGYKYFIENIKTKHITIANGYSSKTWKNNSSKIKNTFLTIGADLGTRFGVKLKGIDLIIEVAQLLPECEFYIIGGDKINIELPNNVHPIGNMPHNELPNFIAEKQFYLQLSMSEGFPNALCEAMLAGCVPIVSKVGAMPQIIGESGYVLTRKDVLQLKELIKKALAEYSEDLSTKAIKQIEDNYTIEKRTELLNTTILQLLN